jgi:hypothetical protein
MHARLAVPALVVALAVPAVAVAQGPWYGSPAYSEGVTRGARAGDEDRRRGQSYNFTDETDYRRADAGYRPQYGPIDRYRDEFRRGFEVGYRQGYSPAAGRGVPPRYDGRPPYDGRGPSGYDGRYAVDRRDLATLTGYTDGYERGLDDGRDRRRFDPIGEGRYRSGDHGYERWYGPKELYKVRYREAFRSGYERGYEDGRRSGQRPWWWIF